MKKRLDVHEDEQKHAEKVDLSLQLDEGGGLQQQEGGGDDSENGPPPSPSSMPSSKTGEKRKSSDAKDKIRNAVMEWFGAEEVTLEDSTDGVEGEKEKESPTATGRADEELKELRAFPENEDWVEKLLYVLIDSHQFRLVTMQLAVVLVKELVYSPDSASNLQPHHVELLDVRSIFVISLSLSLSLSFSLSLSLFHTITTLIGFTILFFLFRFLSSFFSF